MRGMSLHLGLGFVVSLCFAFVAAEDYLKEKPSFLKPCHIRGSDNDRGKCIGAALENVFTKWKDGVPGLKGLNSVDPFQVKKLRVSQNTPNGANVRLELRNLLATGLSKTKVYNSSVSEKDYTFWFHMFLPSMKIDSDYKVKGNVLFLSLDGQGKAKTKINDLDYSVVLKTALKQVGAERFFDVISVSSSVNKIGNFNTDFTNLFNGNIVLEESTRQLFRDNWRDIFEIVRPGILRTMDSVLLDRYKKILSFVPARFFIEDLP